MQINTSIIIHANIEKVWNFFIQFEYYSNWNPFIKSITGKIEKGNRFKVELGGMKFEPTVLVFEKQKEFTWLGQLFFKGLFDGQHQFLFIDNGDGTTTFHQNESFSGILVPILKRKLLNETKPSFELMNLKMKEAIEK